MFVSQKISLDSLFLGFLCKSPLRRALSLGAIGFCKFRRMSRSCADSVKHRLSCLGSEYHIWLCGSKIHILFAATRSAQVASKHIFLSPHCPSTGSPGNLDLNYSIYSYSGLLRHILLSLVRGQRVSIFVPHISTAITDADGVRLLWRLYSLGLVHFYDDGMTAISSRTILYRDGFLPQGAPVDALNYHWCSPSRVGTFSDLSLAHRALLRAFSGVDLPGIDSVEAFAHDGEARSRFSSESGVTTIVLASKWMDYDALNAELLGSRVNPSDAIYIPHYNAIKDSPVLMATCTVRRCYFPELFLSRLFEIQRCRLYYGVTSTAIYICELLHRGELSPFEPIFISSRSLAIQKRRGGEWDDYARALSHYQCLWK